MEELPDEPEEVPAICRRIRETRESLVDEDGRKLSQEKVARRMGLTIKTYRAFETYREPSAKRLREIALAMELEEDYFERAVVTDQVRDAVRAELADVLAALARLEARLSREAPPPEDA